MIEVRDLRKRYGSLDAVAGVNLSVQSGEVFALLGPNGAGKSTTVEILEGHRSRDGGSVSVLGEDPEQAGSAFRSKIGIVLQSEAIEKELTVEEALDIYGAIYPKRIDTSRLISLVGLGEKTDSRIKTLSGGQRRRLELALGLVGDPDLLFLDEPTTGFDPSARRQAWTVIEGLKSLGKTILLTTHYMDEAQFLADRVAVISRGRIVAEGTPEDLGGRASSGTVIAFRLRAVGPASLPVGMEFKTSDDGEISIETADATATLHRLTGWAIEHDLELMSLNVSRPTLEDIYLALTAEDAAT